MIGKKAFFVWIMMVFASAAWANDLPAGQWLLEVPGKDRALTLDGAGHGEDWMIGGAKRAVDVRVEGNRLILQHPEGPEVFTIVEKKGNTYQLTNTDGREAELSLRKPATGKTGAKPSVATNKPVTAGDHQGTSAPKQAAPSATKVVHGPLATYAGTWILPSGKNKGNGFYFGPDGYFMKFDFGKLQAGSYTVNGKKIVVRYNKKVGYLSYLSNPQTISLLAFEPGKSMRLGFSDGEFTYKFLSTAHPHGTESTISLDTMMGRYLLQPANHGNKEIWEFKPSGWVHVNRPGEFVARRYVLEGNTLIVKTLTKSFRFPIQQFQRGKGFLLKTSAGYDVFRYMDGIHYAPPFDQPVPSKARLDQALAQEIAITKKAHATSNAINASTAAMSRMMDDMADDIADRPYRYEYRIR